MKRIGEILLEHGWVQEAVLERALAKQREIPRRLCSLLIAAGVLKVDEASRALGEQLGVAAVLQKHLDHRARALAELIPAELARSMWVLPIGRLGSGELIVCARDPQPTVIAALAAAVAGPIVLAVAPASQIEALVAETYGAPDEDFDVDMSTGPIVSLDLDPIPDDPMGGMATMTLVELDDRGVTRDPSQSGLMQVGAQQRPPALPPSSPGIRIPPPTTPPATVPVVAAAPPAPPAPPPPEPAAIIVDTPPPPEPPRPKPSEPLARVALRKPARMPTPPPVIERVAAPRERASPLPSILKPKEDVLATRAPSASPTRPPPVAGPTPDTAPLPSVVRPPAPAPVAVVVAPPEPEPALEDPPISLTLDALSEESEQPPPEPDLVESLPLPTPVEQPFATALRSRSDETVPDVALSDGSLELLPADEPAVAPPPAPEPPARPVRLDTTPSPRLTTPPRGVRPTASPRAGTMPLGTVVREPSRPAITPPEPVAAATPESAVPTTIDDGWEGPPPEPAPRPSPTRPPPSDQPMAAEAAGDGAPMTAPPARGRIDPDLIAAAYAAPPPYDAAALAAGTIPPKRRAIVLPATLPETLTALAEVTTADGATAAAMRFASSRWRTALLLQVKEKSALGEAGHGSLLGEDVVAGLVIPLGVVSIVTLALEARGVCTELPTTDSPVQDRLDRLLGMPRYPSAIVISVAGRRAYVLVVGDATIDDTDAATVDLDQLASALGAAYTRLGSV
jgi:hypothetical protein